ncbi:MAG: hypothetical protein IJU39_03535 [Clostridia bacterium]|nr:hypothetical protein [Clostridia bacterium]
MSDKTLNISWVYPDLLNLHGDRGNVMALEKVAKLMGITPKVTRVDTFSERIDFENSDIILFNVGEVKTVAPIVENLKKYGNGIYDFANRNKVIVAVGSTGAILAKQLKRRDGSTVEGLGILDMNCVERNEIYGDDLYYTLDDKTEILAVQIHIVDFFLENENDALGKIVYGKGNNDSDSTEGAKKNNVYFTNALGPVFVKNPWFAQKIIAEAMKQKGVEIEAKDLSKEFETELKSAEYIKKFIKNKG